jgi:hypothetical protein
VTAALTFGTADRIAPDPKPHWSLSVSALSRNPSSDRSVMALSNLYDLLSFRIGSSEMKVCEGLYCVKKVYVL